MGRSLHGRCVMRGSGRTGTGPEDERGEDEDELFHGEYRKRETRLVGGPRELLS